MTSCRDALQIYKTVAKKKIKANMSESMNREIIMNSQTKYNTCLFISSMLKIQTVLKKE